MSEILTDEEIYGREPSLEEQTLIDENNKLKMKLIDADDKLDNAEYTIDKINKIVTVAIADNIRKTRMVANVSLVKKYREELLILRELEKELNDYNNRMVRLLQ